ncbi:MAG: MBL fold metallo-hydrolase [Candidatus Humimicrobiaceae bacterium]
MKNNADSRYFKIELISEGLWSIEDYGFDMAYLVEGTEKALLVDTGMGIGDIKKIVKKITPKPVIVVNTHGDPDHCGGNFQFSEACMHPYDFDLIKESYNKPYRMFVAEAFTSLSLGYPPFPYNTWKQSEQIGLSEEVVTFDDWINSQPCTLIPVRQGHIFELGHRKLEVIEIPGHSRGSIGLIDYNAKILFTGDSVLPQDIWMFIERCTSLKIYLQSLLYLQDMAGSYEIILPGHGRKPIDGEYVNELIICSKKILDGSCKGERCKTFLGEALRCSHKRISIIYDENKLF